LGSENKVPSVFRKGSGKRAGQTPQARKRGRREHRSRVDPKKTWEKALKGKDERDTSI